MIVMVMMTMMLMMILIGIQTRQPDDDFDNIKSQKESMTVFPKVTASLLVAWQDVQDAVVQMERSTPRVLRQTEMDEMGNLGCVQSAACSNRSFKVHTVNGSNPANQLIGRISHYLQLIFYMPGGFLAGFQPSTVALYIYSMFDW